MFPFPNWTWIARELRDHQYLMASLNIDWRDEVLHAGQLILGDIPFAITPYDFASFNKGVHLRSYSIQGFPS